MSPKEDVDEVAQRHWPAADYQYSYHGDAVHHRREHGRCLGEHVQLECLLPYGEEKLSLSPITPKIAIGMARPDIPECLFAIEPLEAGLEEDATRTVVPLRELIVAKRPFHVNDDTIEWIEALADTRLHMTSGETKITCMSATEVLATMVAARRINVHNPPQVRPHREDVEAWDSDRRQ